MSKGHCIHKARTACLACPAETCYVCGGHSLALQPSLMYLAATGPRSMVATTRGRTLRAATAAPRSLSTNHPRSRVCSLVVLVVLRVCVPVSSICVRQKNPLTYNLRGRAHTTPLISNSGVLLAAPQPKGAALSMPKMNKKGRKSHTGRVKIRLGSLGAACVPGSMHVQAITLGSPPLTPVCALVGKNAGGP